MVSGMILSLAIVLGDSLSSQISRSNSNESPKFEPLFLWSNNSNVDVIFAFKLMLGAELLILAALSGAIHFL